MKLFYDSGCNSGKGNPFYYIDEDGNMPSPPQGLVDFAAGFGDNITFGISKSIRNLYNIGNINNCSSYYLIGEYSNETHY